MKRPRALTRTDKNKLLPDGVAGKWRGRRLSLAETSAGLDSPVGCSLEMG